MGYVLGDLLARAQGKVWQATIASGPAGRDQLISPRAERV